MGANRVLVCLMDRVADEKQLLKLCQIFELFKLCPLGNQVVAGTTGRTVSSRVGG